MRQKFFYNILLNIGIFVLIYCAIAAFNAKQYVVLGLTVIGLFLVIYLKIRLAKNIRTLLKEGKKP